MDARFVVVDDAELEVSDWGSGDPIVFVQTALIADELVPLATQPALRDGFRKILYHRRGYTGSRGLERAGSIGRDADDVRSLLSAMGIPRAHIVGVSYSGAVHFSSRLMHRSAHRAWSCPSHHQCTPRSGRSFVPRTSGSSASGTIAA